MRYLLFTLLIILCLPMAVAAGDVFGLCVTPYWPDTPNHGVCYSEAVAKDISVLGAKVMRCEFLSKRDGSMDYVGWDEITRRAKRHGLKIIGVLDYSTLSAPNKAGWTTPDYAERFAKRAAEIAKRYKGCVGTWEIWNEPNFADFRLDPEPYANLLCKTYSAIKAVDRRAVICSAGLAGAWSGGDNNSAKEYLQDLYNAKATRQFFKEHKSWPFDAVGNHPYAWDTEPSKYLQKALRENILAVMESHGDSRKPILVTESGWNVDPKDGTKMGPDEKANLVNQAKWLTDLYDLALKMKRKDGSPVVSVMCWYCYHAPGGMGLREFGSNKKRPAYDAYQKAARASRR